MQPPPQLSGDLTGIDVAALLRRLGGTPGADGVTRVPIASDGDGLMYVMTRMADTEGWEPFRKAFRELYGLDPAVSCGATKWEKIDCFFSVVSRYASKDLLETYFTPAQIAALKTLK